MNASGKTNFIFKVGNLSKGDLDNINSTKTLKDRLNKIIEFGGIFYFHQIEQETMSYNLRIIDSMMPETVAQMLLEFFC